MAEPFLEALPYALGGDGVQVARRENVVDD